MVTDRGRGVDAPAPPERERQACAPPSSIAYVTFGSKTATRPTEHAETWDVLADRLTRHARRPGKDGPGWSPARYKRDKHGQLLTRANASVEALTCAVADLDHIGLDDVVTIREHLRDLGLTGVIYSTHSSTDTEPRVRVVVPLADPAPADLCPRLWPTLAERIFLGLADTAASDPARLYYLPSAPADALTIADRWDGAALDWRSLPLADPQAPATPAETTGAGAAESVAPEDMPILERLFSARRGEQRMRAWMGDYADFDGNASAADQSLANGLMVYCQGDVGRAERIMRAGPWRPKWDDRRGATTVLGLTLGKALAAYRAWADKQEAANDAGDVSADETPAQTITRLQRELAQARTVIATQQPIIRNLRTENDEYRQRAQETAQVFRNRTLGATEKLLAIVAVWRVESGARRGEQEIRAFYPELAEAAGVSESTVGRYMAKLTDGPDAPLAKRTETEWRTVTDRATGQEVRRPTSATFLRARGEGSILTAVANYHPENRPKHGGKRVAGCPAHPAADLIIRTVTQCAECRRPIGQPTETLRRQVDVVEEQTGTCERTGTYGQQLDVVGGHDGAEQSEAASNVVPLAPLFPPEMAGSSDVCDTHGRYLTHQERRTGCSWCADGPPAAPVAPQPRRKRWHCRCGSLEGHSIRSGLGWRCDGCGHETGPLAAVAGGSE